MDKELNVYQKLSKIQTELKAPKNQLNKFGGYNYRSCEDILEALKPLLKKYNVAVTISDEVINLGDRYYIQATVKVIDTENNEVIETKALAREEEHKKGMDSSQITGSASSYARKYALNGMFSIDDTKDSDSTNTHEDFTDFKSENNKDLKVENKWTNPKLTDKQINRLYAIAYNEGYNADKIKAMVMQRYNKDISNLTKTEYDYICKSLEKKSSEVGA